LPPAAIRQIVDIQMKLVEERLAAKNIKLVVDPAVYDFLGKEGHNPQYGARPLKRLIQNKILNLVASLMISKGVLEGGVVTISLKNGEFVFDVKKGRKGPVVVEKTDLGEEVKA